MAENLVAENQVELLSVVVGGRRGKRACENGTLLLLALEFFATLLFFFFGLFVFT